jgi:hypothetical protein
VHVAVFSTLGQQWLVNTHSSRRGRPETAMEGLLLLRATPLLLPRATRWKAPAAAAPLLLPHVYRRWEAPVVAHRSSSLLQLGRLGGDVGVGSSSSSDTPGAYSSSDTCLGVPLPQRCELILNTRSRFQLFSIITKYKRSFSYLKVTKQIGFCWTRTSAGQDGQCRTDALYQC